ncbi:MAG: GGDEF domain-containing protein [Cellulosilyticum sp.]|nr:GGDEF domain-containing protein [Cellulosilyticum sp.]
MNELEKEVIKLKSDPQYIDFFMKVVRQKLGEKIEVVEPILKEAMQEYAMQQCAVQNFEKQNDTLQEDKLPEKALVYGKLLLLKTEYALLSGMLNDAIKMGEEALEIFKTQEELIGLIEVKGQLLSAYTLKGEWEQANLYRQKIASKRQEVDEPNLQIQMTLGIVKFYIAIKDYKSAKESLQYIQDRAQWLTPKDEVQLNILYLMLYLEENRLEKAREYGNKAYNLVADFKEEGTQLYEVGEVLRLRGKLNGARKLQMQAEKDFKTALKMSVLYKEVVIKTYIDWGKYLIEEEQLEEAKKQLMKASEQAKEMEASYLLVEVYSLLKDIYEKTSQWEAADQMLQSIEKEQKQMSVPIQEVIHKESSIEETAIEQNAYQEAYGQLQKIARLGSKLTSNLSLENLEEAIKEELKDLMPIDVMGIGMMENGKLQYNLYDLQEGWLPSNNDLLRYTARLADYCTQYQLDLVINNGNFEEYSLKKIINSKTGMQLKSMIVMALKVEHQVVGVVAIGSYEPGAYSPKDIEMAKIVASYLGFTLKNTSLCQEIQYLTEHDKLTGLLSRTVVLKNGEKLFKENHRKHQQTAIMMLEVDAFKRMNQKYGYTLGDEILSSIGEIIQAHMPTENEVGRYGGKAFIAIFNNLTGQEAMQIGEEIRKQLEEMTFETKKEKDIKVTLSGGLYMCNEYTLNFDDAIRFADHALYRAKLLGGNCIVNYDLKLKNKLNDYTKRELAEARGHNRVHAVR